MQNNLVSIALATYNGEKYLKKQIDSILNQTYNNIELIICDDCSNDDSVDILREYQSKYNNIRIYQNLTNLGFAKNFEKAMKLCNGKYIALADQDDIWFPEKIETCVNNLGSKSVICSAQTIIDETDNIIYDKDLVVEEAISRASKCNYDFFKMLHFRNFCTGCTMLLKKDFLNKVLPIPENVFHDWWIAIVAAYYDELKVYNKPLMYYRHHQDNETAKLRIRGKNKKQISDFGYFLHLLSDKNQEKIQRKKFNTTISLLSSFGERFNLSQSEKLFNQNCINFFNSILNFRFSKQDFLLLKFQLEYIKYMSVKHSYFYYLCFLRIFFLCNKRFK